MLPVTAVALRDVADVAPAAPLSGVVPRGTAAPVVPSVTEIFREHGSFVLRLLRRLGIPESDLDDVVQDVFMTVHRGIDRYEERNQLRAWLYRITVREASRHRRARQPQGTVDVEQLIASPAAGPEEQAQATEARADFERLLAVLDEDRRTVFVLYEVEELSMDEVAKIVDCPVPTAHSRLRSARKLVLAAAKRLEIQRRMR
jgi:RNA polymerase sigma-70 factor (ECF subfamily)